ncbi:MAG: organomercurial lyase MerB [Streptosporangiales bacterium]|nr:organomercurial lyase MerB [Streptosporangiales bacterium]
MDTLQRSLVEFIQRQEMPAFFPALLRLVAKGEPVSLDELAAEGHTPVEQLDGWLRAQPGTDWAPDGRLLGFGLTQRETPHRFTVDGRTLFAFCAADTLLFPAVLGRPASVESTCPATGRTVRLEVTQDAVASLDPETAAVTQAALSGGSSDIRAQTCDLGHFYASAEAAASWRAEHPDGDVRPVREFHALGVEVERELGWVA